MNFFPWWWCVFKIFSAFRESTKSTWRLKHCPYSHLHNSDCDGGWQMTPKRSFFFAAFQWNLEFLLFSIYWKIRNWRDHFIHCHLMRVGVQLFVTSFSLHSCARAYQFHFICNFTIIKDAVKWKDFHTMKAFGWVIHSISIHAISILVVCLISARLLTRERVCVCMALMILSPATSSLLIDFLTHCIDRGYIHILWIFKK